MTINVAIVGAGNIARTHLSALRESQQGNVVGLFDADASRAEQRAAEFGVNRIYRGWDELLADRDVQVVAVLVPPDLHHRFSVEALAAGKNVVCEKPMAADLAECDAMLAAARQAGRRLFIVQNRIYSPAYEKANELQGGGSIGTVFLAQSNGFEGPNTVWRSPWLASSRGGNGVLMAQSVHPAYALRWMLGDVERVSCIFGGRKVIDMTHEDTAVVTLRFASGVLGEMTATFGLTNGPFDHAIMFYGSEGYVEIRNQSGSSARPQSLRVISPRAYNDTDIHDVELPTVTHLSSQFQRMWDDYLHAIETGESARVSDIDGRKAVELILAAHRSAELGRAIKLPLS